MQLEQKLHEMQIELENLVWDKKELQEHFKMAVKERKMMEREMITMIVDTLPVFYYEKMVGYMSSSFADLVFASERIKVGLRRGKLDYAASASTNNRRSKTGEAKKKEGDTHVVTSVLSWPKSQQTLHNPTYQYSPHQPNYSANVGIPPNPAPIQQRFPTQPQ